jgi:2-phospho-L-lactate/phosphoenolpyruvate guanylyltransferase
VTHRTWAIVPAKSLTHGKSRLRAVLADDDRVRFARRLLEHVLGVLRESALEGVLVATDGDDVDEIAQRAGASVLRDQGDAPNKGTRRPRTLAAVVDRALHVVAARGASAAVVLMADLPLLEPEDVDTLTDALTDYDIVLVRDHLGRHTNALAVAPPTAIETCFGRKESFAEHCAAARTAGLRVAILENDRIAFDVDGPADHLAFTGRRRGPDA